MNVFLLYPSIAETVRSLDTCRLHKQQIECSQILSALQTKGAWSNHPATKMWSQKTHVLNGYINIAKAELAFRRSNIPIPQQVIEDSMLLEQELSGWLPEEFFIQHRKRLFTKDNVFYSAFGCYGESYVNYYFVGSVILRYNTITNKREATLPVVELSVQVCISL